MGRIFNFAQFTLDLEAGCLRAGHAEIVLRPKSFALLRYLIENANRLVSKDELMRAVWPNVIVSDDSLKRCVSEVRTALDDKTHRIVKTVPRRGFRFIAPLFDVPAETPI